jgi:hypothetical protein
MHPLHALGRKDLQPLYSNMPAGVVPQGHQALKLTMITMFNDIHSLHRYSNHTKRERERERERERVGLWLEKQFTALRDESVDEQICFLLEQTHVRSMDYSGLFAIPVMKLRVIR